MGVAISKRLARTSYRISVLTVCRGYYPSDILAHSGKTPSEISKIKVPR
jgi:hypothetical protein